MESLELLGILGYAAAVVVGLVLGLIGGGGSILTVPVLVYLLKVDAEMATAYSLFVVGISAAFGAVQNYRNGLVDMKTGIVFALPSLAAVYATRRWMIPAIPDSFEILGLGLTKNLLIMGLFAMLMIAASVSMIRGRKETTQAEGQAKWWLVPIEGALVGVLTGMVGAGGGFLIIPALVVLVRMPMKTAVGTSLMIIAFKSLIGFIGDLGTDKVMDWTLLGLFTALTVAGILIGMQLAKRVDGKSLKKGFGYFVLVMGTFILLKEIM